MMFLAGQFFCPYYVSLAKFAQPILTKKLYKYVATRCHIFKVKMHKFDFTQAGGKGQAVSKPQPLLSAVWPRSAFRFFFSYNL